MLILTSYDDDPYISAVLKTGANGYVLKTASPDEIISAVRDVYHGRSVLDATILPKVLAQIAHPTPTPVFEPLTDREIETLTLVAR
ncbi:MAG: DNA-binding response regulator, partial [Anaerolineaceae bacterium]|nr:DNA-binding response regulator [Anaerolineaceae bacterium]